MDSTKTLREFNTNIALQEWNERIKECRSSGLTVRAWCKENNISHHAYYYWQKRLFELATQPQESRFAEIPLPAAPSPSSEAVAKISLNGIEVEVFSNTTAPQLSMLLSVLKQC